MPDPFTRLELRLERAMSALLDANATLTPFVVKERDMDTVLTAEGAPKKPIIVLSAQDTGAVQLTPIRQMRLGIAIRGNSKTTDGSAAAFDAISAAMELLLDTTNLKTALTSSTLGISVMMAVRNPGTEAEHQGFIRTQRYVLDVRAVGSEHVAS